MITLGIETSCDETALALVRDGQLLHSVMSTQIDIHSLFGGVVPEIASREHYRLIGRLYDDLLSTTGISMKDVDTIAVSRGPGLLGSLLVGLGFAKGLAAACSTRLIGINHLHAHLLAAGLEQPLSFPAVGLLVSGGHTHIYNIAGPHAFTLLGRTLDDAAGEAFDKVAKMLNMPYPGGRYIDALGRMAEPDEKLFTKPYLDNTNLDFSFSGLKTSVGLYIQKNPHLILASPDQTERLFDGSMDSATTTAMAQVCASFNHTVAETLRIKLHRAVEQILGRGEALATVIVAGGVAANSRVREAAATVARSFNLKLALPSPFLCTDNGAMVAYAGELLASMGLYHGLDLEGIPRGQKIPEDYLQNHLQNPVYGAGNHGPLLDTLSNP